jgi:hypothetical protein
VCFYHQRRGTGNVRVCEVLWGQVFFRKDLLCRLGSDSTCPYRRSHRHTLKNHNIKTDIRHTRHQDFFIKTDIHTTGLDGIFDNLLSSHLIRFVLSCLALPCLVLSFLSCLVMSRLALPYLVLSYLVVLSCLFLSCLALSCVALSCICLILLRR